MRTEPTDIPRTTDPAYRAWVREQACKRERRPKPTQEPEATKWPRKLKESKQ